MEFDCEGCSNRAIKKLTKMYKNDWSYILCINREIVVKGGYTNKKSKNTVNTVKYDKI